MPKRGRACSAPIFGEGRTFWTIDALAEFAPTLGLDEAETRAVLESGRYRSGVENDQREAQRLSASGTPFIVIDRKYGIAGVRDAEALLSAMRDVWKQTHATENLVAVGGKGQTCSVDGCD